MSPRSLILPILSRMQPITLAESERVKLQERRDTKYVLPVSTLALVLSDVADEYRVLEIEETRIQTYHSTYFDTVNRQTYLEHHNGHLNRTKVRIRDYVESELSFFELKTKDNLRRTVKARVPIDFLQLDIPELDQPDLTARIKTGLEGMIPVLKVRFGRVMLANLERDERVTIDVDLEFELLRDGSTRGLGPLAIVEVKRPRHGATTPIQFALSKHHIKKSSMSKYCVGTALLDQTLKNNRFKPLLRRIEAIANTPLSSQTT